MSLVLLLITLLPLLQAKQDCVPGDWSDWSNCDKTCGAIGTRERTRKIQVLPSSDGRPCSDFQFEEIDPCNRVCFNGGVVSTNECVCQRGWAGACCDYDINECDNANGGCQQQCTNIEGSWTCSCYNGYKEDASKTCKDIDECAKENRLTLSGCQDYCMNFAGGFKCACAPPKILEHNNRTCSDENWCVTHTDAQGCKGGCVLVNNEYKCVCPTGHKLQDDGFTCKDIDECSNPNFCVGGTCQNLNYTAICSCGSVRGLDAEGRKCIDVDECLAGMNQCSHICENRNAGHVCLCPAGYVIGADHKTCIDDDECSHDPSPCSHSCTNLDGSFSCLCPDGWALQDDDMTCCEIGKCPSLSSKNPNAEGGSHGWTIAGSVLAVIIVVGVLLLVYRQLKRTQSSNEKVMRAIRTGDAPDVYYNRGADNIELETRGVGLTMGLGATTSGGGLAEQTAAPYHTFGSTTHRNKHSVD